MVPQRLFSTSQSSEKQKSCWDVDLALGVLRREEKVCTSH